MRSNLKMTRQFTPPYPTGQVGDGFSASSVLDYSDGLLARGGGKPTIGAAGSQGMMARMG
jgi:hypothetical protein